jgi:WD40 repeat protein
MNMDRTVAEEKQNNQDEAAVPIEWNIGDVILDTYKVTGILGEGGMGKVYKVRHLHWNADLAVKCALPEIAATKKGHEDFVREAETWTNLSLHPNIVYCYYVRTLGGIPRVFAEYVDGGSLKDAIADGSLYEGGKDKAFKRIMDLAIQSAWGLQYAHEQGLIHQDVKPANLLLTQDGAAKVTDFGLANAKGAADVKLEGRGGTLNATWGGMTPEYCSPEQAEIAEQHRTGVPRERWIKLTRRTDIWSFATTVLEMFLGERVWQLGQAAGHSLEGYDTDLLPENVPEMPNDLKKLLWDCFLEDEAKRPNSIADVAERLAKIYREATGEQYLRIAPEAVKLHAAALNNKAVSLYDLGKTVEAEKLWEEALREDLNHPETNYNLGLIQWRSGRMMDDKLTGRLEFIASQNLSGWLPKYLLALTQMERYDFEIADRMLEKLQTEYPKNHEISIALKLAKKNIPHTIKCLRTFKGHTSDVYGVCLSADGRYALSGSYNGMLMLWDIATGECLRTFEGHNSKVYSVCLSADGRYGLSGSHDKTLKLWDISTTECLQTFEGHTKAVSSVCLSADGRYALSGSHDKTLKLWDIATSECQHTFEGHTADVYSVCLSADGRYALSGSEDTTLRLWDISTCKCLRTFEGHTKAISTVCLSADGRYTLTGSWDKTLRLWNITTGICLRTFETSEYSICLCADSRFALSVSDRALRLWDITTGKCLRTFKGHTDYVNSVCLSADGRYALSGSRDKTLRLWSIDIPIQQADHMASLILSEIRSTTESLSEQADLKDALEKARRMSNEGDIVGEYKILRELIRAQIHNIPELIARFSELYLKFPKNGLILTREQRILKWYNAYFDSVCMSADGRFALSGGIDETLRLCSGRHVPQLRLWDIVTGECMRTFEGHTLTVESVCLSADGRYALSGSHDWTLKLWNITTGECLRTFEGHTNYIHSVCLSADGRYALSGSTDETLRLWDIATGICLRTFEGHTDGVRSVCLSADGRFALSGSADGTLKLWELLTGECLRTFKGHTKYVRSVCLSADGRYALSGSTDETLRLWDIATGKCLRTFEGHADDVCSVCLSADRRHALSGSNDQTCRLWDITTGECLRTFKVHTFWVRFVCMSANGQYFLSLGSNLQLWTLFWDLEPKEPADWDVDAKPLLLNFLILHTPYAGNISTGHEPTKDEVRLALTRKGKPSWTEEDFKRLLYTLGCVGYGWLRPEGVRTKLNELAKKMKDGTLQEHNGWIKSLWR